MRLSLGRRSVRFLFIPVLVITIVISLLNATDSWPDWNHAKVTSPLDCSTAPKTKKERSLSDEPVLHQTAYDRSLNEPSSESEGCRRRKASQADVDTLDIFPNLNFQPDYLHKRDYWDSSLEKRYEGYKTDKSRPPLKVIVLPHSHVDPGWLKTFEQYYAESTQSILDNMVNKLTQHKNMTFIWTEIAFFALWWESAPPAKRRQVLHLVDQGRLEFTSGTWVMTDEANAHLYSMLDQMIEGHQWVKSNLGVVPKSAWSVDPFGHGPVAPYLLSQAGLENTVVQRIHYSWKRWMADHQMSDFRWQMPWKPSSSDENIVCHNFPYDIYSTKHSCGPHPKTCLGYDFRSIRGEYNEFTVNAAPITRINVEAKSDVLLQQYAKTGSLTTHNVVLALVGDDFRFNYELEWDQQYSNYQSIFNFVSANKRRYNGTEIGFGTLSDYFDAVKKRVRQYPTLKGDFFPYSDIFSEGRPAYWTGYFTSRPFYKSLAREVESRIRGAEILFTLSLNRAKQNNFRTAKRIMDHDYGLLVKARRHLALFQHHDAITGTSKSVVMQDYGQKLFEALKSASRIEARGAAIMMSNDDEQWQRFQLLPTLQRPSHDRLPQKMTLELTAPAEGEEMQLQTVVLYNSDAHFRSELVRLKISWPYVRVVDPEGRKIPHQVNPVWTLQKHRKLENAVESYQLVFIAPLAPLSLTTFRILRMNGETNITRTAIYSTMDMTLSGPFEFQEMKKAADIQVENKKIKLLFNGQTGFLKSIRMKATNKSTPCAMQFSAYPSAMFHSGAYLFMPDPNAEQPQIDVLKGFTPQILIISGPVMSEVSVVYQQLLIHSTFILHNKMEDLIWMETSLDMGSAPNYREHEFFIRFKTTIENSNGNNSAEFFTDQNGFTMAKRRRVNSLGIEASYYPMTSSAFIQDDQQRLNLLVNGAKGFASLTPGWMEFMIDRRTIHDDGRGMGEGMIDNLATHTPFILLLEEKAGSPEKEIPNLSVQAASASMMLMYPATSLAVDTEDPKVLEHLSQKRVMMLSQPMPCNIHLVGLRTLSTTREIDVDLPSDSALFTVHNRAFECSIQGGHVPRCALSESDKIFYPKTSFIGLDLLKVQETSLTGLKMIGKTDFDSAKVPLMELRSFNLTFV